LETYPKEHSAGYHGQALIDLAFKIREKAGERVGDVEGIKDITIHTKELTHLVMGSGANDPEKWDPKASRETLDHSAMFIFTVALQDGFWDHDTSYDPTRVSRPDTVALWQKVRTVSDPLWTSAFVDPAPLEKAHGAMVVIRFADGETVEDEIRVANAHPRGETPWTSSDYRKKFKQLSQGHIEADEAEHFLDRVEALPTDQTGNAVDLAIDVGLPEQQRGEPGLFG